MSTEVHVVVSREDAGRLTDELLQIEEIKSLQVNNEAPSAKYPLRLDVSWVEVAIHFGAALSAHAIYDVAKRLANSIRGGTRVEIIWREEKTIDVIGLDRQAAAELVEKMLTDP